MVLKWKILVNMDMIQFSDSLWELTLEHGETIIWIGQETNLIQRVWIDCLK